jgi:adenylate cyclase
MTDRGLHHHHKHDRLLRPLLVGLGIGAMCALAATAGVFSSWSARVTDRFFTRMAPDPSILIVAIDDASISSVGRWPWDRSTHAELVRKLSNAGASVIAYDVNFSEPEDAKNDGDLAEAIASAHRFVLPIELRLDQRADGTIAYDAERTLRPIPELAHAATALGHTNMPPDTDGVVRRVPVSAADRSDANPVPSFANVIAALADRTPNLRGAPLDAGNRIVVRFDGPPHSTFPTISAADALSGRADLAIVRNKIVLVGSTAQDLHDEQLVPTSDGIPMPGVEIHASLLDTLLKRDWLRPISAWELALLLIAIGLAFGWLVPRMRQRWSALTAVIAWIALVVAASIAFDRGFIIDVFWPTLAIALVYGGVTLERRIAAEHHRRWLKGLLTRYVSPTIVDEIIRNPDRLRLGGERREMTVLFSDIRGFTRISEATPPEDLVRYLNAYLGRMTDIVFEHEGVLDKYVGDAVMAFWNAPLDQEDHARSACLAALAMRDALREMNGRRVFGAHTFRIGIGINTGDMVVGNMGGEVHTDYTVIGDSVNLASRLEGLTKEYRAEVIVSEATRKAAGDAVFARKLDRVAVKGKQKTVTIYEILASADRVTSADRERAEAYESALDLYFERKFDDVLRIIEEYATKYPDDAAMQVLSTHATEFAAHPPPSNWDGTWIWTRK